MRNGVTVAELKVFLDVAATGSFTEASARQQTTPSTISRHIASLERKLGQRLFYRHTRAVRLTDAGSAYASDVRPALDLLETAGDRMAGHHSEPKGVLRVNAPVAFGSLHVAPFLFDFQARHPSVEVELSLTDALVDPVAEGADVVIRIGAKRDSSLTGRTLWPQRYRLCASPEYLRQQGIPTSTADLQQHDCLVYTGSGGAESWQFRKDDGSRDQVIPRARFRSNHAETLVNAAVSGRGIIFFPAWLVSAHLNDGRLAAITSPDLQTHADEARIHAIIPENGLRSSKVALFLEGIIAHIGRHPFWDT